MMYVILLNMLMLVTVMELAAAIYDAVRGKDNETYQNEEK